MGPGGDELTGHDRADSQLAEQLGGEPTDQPVELDLEFGASRSQASARRAVDRIANTVADSSMLRRAESRSPAQLCRSSPSGKVRSLQPCGQPIEATSRVIAQTRPSRVRRWGESENTHKECWGC